MSPFKSKLRKFPLPETSSLNLLILPYIPPPRSSVIFLFILVSTALSQELSIDETRLTFSGYVMELPFYESIKPSLAQLNSMPRSSFENLARIRFRPTLRIDSNTKIGVEYEIDGLYHSQNLSFDLTSSHPLRQIVSLHWQPVEQDHILILHYIDRLYFNRDFPFGVLTIGRQRISWGTGRVWNPTDIFNPINPANFGKVEKDGADAASMKLYFGQLTDLQLVYNAEYHFKSSNYAARFRTNISGYDIALLAGYADRHLLAGGDFAGNVSTAGIRGEALVSEDPSKGGGYYIRWLLGMDYQFTDKLYGMFEYYHNGQGTLNRYNYDLIDLYEGKILNVAKDYIALSGSCQTTPLITIILSSISNFNDGSGYVSGTINYSTSDNTSIAFGLLYTHGKTFTEYWYYPAAYYLKLEGFF